MLSDRCLSVCPVCDVRALWPNGWTNQDETWHESRPRPWPHCVRWGPSSPSPKGAQPPIFGPYPLRPNGCIDQDATWYGGRPWPRRLCARWGPCSPSPRRGAEPPKFLAHVYYFYFLFLLFWSIIIIFGSCLLWPNGWIDQDDTWHGDRPQPRRLCIKLGPSLPPKFSAHVYYSYCDFVRTLHRRKALLVC